jgi:tetratricopeptide (TPR) repeat protein
VEAFKARKNEAAIGYLTKAVAVKDPKVKDFYYAEAYSTLGLIYQYRIKTVGHRETARKYYRKALAIDPSTASAKQGLKLLGPGENGAGQKHPGTAVSPQ